MKIKSHYLSLGLLAAALATLAPGRAAAQTDPDDIARIRSILKADRQAVVADALQLSEAESQAFWPIYHQYRAEMDKVGDGLVKLMQDYAQLHPNVPDDRARLMLQQLMDLERKRLATRQTYLKRSGKALPAAKNLRFAQVENRLDLAVHLKLASVIPLVPIEGRLTGEATGAAAVVEGVPGGVVVQTYELAATVVAIDHGQRKVTLLDSAGIKATVRAGPDVINFDQIRVGDRLRVVATEELVVYVAGQGETQTGGAARFVALAPKGAKPGGLMAETTQVTARVAAIDAQNHRATLRFEDGTTRTVAVREDVDLAKRRVGEEVVIRKTESLAIKVGKP